MSIHGLAPTFLAAGLRRADEADARLARAAFEGEAAGMAEAIMRLAAARRQFETALKIARTEDELVRRALDLFA